MLWFFAGIAIVVLLSWICAEKGSATTFLVPLGVLIVLIVGLIPPMCVDEGYAEKRLADTIELVPLSTNATSAESDKKIYVTVNAEKVYTYRYEVENTSELKGRMYKTEIVDGNVEEVESSEYTIPTLYIYVEKSKNSIWFSYNIADKYTYVFYVPEGTIVRDVILE